MTPSYAQAVDPIFIYVLGTLNRISDGEDIPISAVRRELEALFRQADVLLGEDAVWKSGKYALTAWIDEMFGVPVADAYGLPTALAAPGFQLIATRHGARRSFVMVYLDGLIERHELRAQLPQLREDLLGHQS